MNNITINYALRRTPSTQRALRSILDAQDIFNDRVRWASDRLNLTPVQSDTIRGSLAFPFVRMNEGRNSPAPRLGFELTEDRIPDAVATGRNRLHRVWDAHLLVAFCRRMSELHSVCFELRDESGFIRSGAMLFQNGRAELQRDWLNRQREKVLEVTGSPEAATPYLVAENDALQGRFLVEGEPGDYPADVTEDMDWEQMQLKQMSEVAYDAVRDLLAPAAATQA